MCNPSLQIVLVEEIKICLRHMGEGIGPFLVRNSPIEEPGIVMTEDIITPRLMEIFIFRRLIKPEPLPQVIMFMIVDRLISLPNHLHQRIRECEGPGATYCENKGQEDSRGHSCDCTARIAP